MAGYYGGKVDFIISRFFEVMMTFPVFFLILTILAFRDPSIYNIMIVIGATGWTGIARLVRGDFLKLRKFDYVDAAIALGGS
ncbi:ABC transporter permease subunit, partial [Desulfobacterota bacterium AH_259_B03_O07]|nr:ABC transporter permease subunit [Desulfobacterota bacterium AH_259_B03_O07]